MLHSAFLAAVLLVPSGTAVAGGPWCTAAQDRADSEELRGRGYTRERIVAHGSELLKRIHTARAKLENLELPADAPVEFTDGIARVKDDLTEMSGKVGRWLEHLDDYAETGVRRAVDGLIEVERRLEPIEKALEKLPEPDPADTERTGSVDPERCDDCLVQPEGENRRYHQKR